MWRLCVVSIHVPARGTTIQGLLIAVCDYVSIHVPARGTTVVFYALQAILQVSIHVPARGTTRKLVEEYRLWKFQSTFPQGERHILSTAPHPGLSFNPRSRKGNDNDSYKYPRMATQVSIHVPARGTTLVSCLSHPCTQFQSTFPQGERQSRSGCILRLQSVSIHVPARGTTQSCVRNIAYQSRFQSTFPQGERRDKQASFLQAQAFQSTFPQGERRQTRGKIDNVN